MEIFINIRKATPKDAAQAVPLILEAMGELAYMFSGTTNVEETRSIVEKFFIEETTRTSYKNTIVSVENNSVCGVMIFYGGNQREILDFGILEHLKTTKNPQNQLDRECFENEFYIDSLAVNINFRNQGIATKFFDYAEQEAVKEGFTKIALLVDSENTSAQKYYKNLGFHKDIDLIVNNHLYYHLYKELK